MLGNMLQLFDVVNCSSHSRRAGLSRGPRKRVINLPRLGVTPAGDGKRRVGLGESPRASKCEQQLNIHTQSHRPCRHYGSARALLRSATLSSLLRNLAVRPPTKSPTRATKTKPSSSTATIPPKPNIANPLLPLSRILFHTFNSILAST